MNTKYSIKKVWYYLLCMIMTLQLIACTEETHESYTAAPEVEDIYIDQLEELINKMKDLQKNSEYGEKKGQYPTESRAILTDAIDDANSVDQISESCSVGAGKAALRCQCKICN